MVRIWKAHSSKLRTPLSIAFAFVATHNHFVLDRGGKVFNHSAPIIKLPSNATEEDHLALLGLLNSSTACFWMKQVFHNKGSTVDEKGARQTTVAFENFYEFTGTGLQKFPLRQTNPWTSPLPWIAWLRSGKRTCPGNWQNISRCPVPLSMPTKTRPQPCCAA